jgi:hypothetical protein
VAPGKNTGAVVIAGKPVILFQILIKIIYATFISAPAPVDTRSLAFGSDCRIRWLQKKDAAPAAAARRPGDDRYGHEPAGV